ncbi:dihydrolipoyl dehydrogenase [Salipiger sp. P9]|uniref:dihydrolipoyl dehydrogenase n=1 Tax=Salipiger pentaromativorans TaxID=2943193 RepID=UPI002157B9B2|nr:dihydrolipoyl dehydrogenase [Salipiger pentaromativorans]MCR8549965.1 dihydrolipoyl dehydrogenase [Salipiger pentaromativorans]
MRSKIRIPDIGDFSGVPVVEVLVAVGDSIAADDAILTLESDKATLDVPSPVSGTVQEIRVAEGDLVSKGDVVMIFESVEGAGAPEAAQEAVTSRSADHAPLVVIGAGPGGYTAAFRAADLGRDVTLIDPRATLGGVCLNVGCIPSKALLHIAGVIDEAASARMHGVTFGDPEMDIDAIRGFKNEVIGKLTNGLSGLAARRKVHVIRGTAAFDSPNSLIVSTKDGQTSLSFDQAIIATGSEPARLPFLPEDPRIIDSTGALDLAVVPERMLVIGGGIIGLEMAQVYHALGARIEIVEVAEQIIPGADRDIVAPLAKRLVAKGLTLRTGTRVTAVEAGDALTAHFVGPGGEASEAYDLILVAVGRLPNGRSLGLDRAGIELNESGFVPVNVQMRTRQPSIFAVGDLVGQPMLAHKAVHEAKVAAEIACGEEAGFEPACIPSVAYTNPELAWVGLTEAQAIAQGLKVKTSSFPWAASGRALSMGKGEGLTKLIFDRETGTVLGGAIVGANAGDLISEIALAVEMKAQADDIGLTIHPHPTLSETVAFAADAYLGTLTDL